MSVTIRDVMKLPCMKNAEIVAGQNGIDNVVTAVSVLEYSSFSEYQEKVFKELAYEGSDIMITAFSSIAGHPEKILSEVMNSQAVGEAGLIIYYFDLFVKKLDQSILDFCDTTGFPIIVMPRDQFQLRYSEAITEIQELILTDRSKTENFAPAIMETFLSLPKNQQNASTLLRLLSNYLHLTFIMTEADFSLTAFAGWPNIPEREANEMLLQITDGSFPDSFDMIELDNEPDRHAKLIVTGQGKKIKNSVIAYITDVVRPILKMLGDEASDSIRATQLIRAIIGDEPVKVRRLAKSLGVHTDNLRNMVLYRHPGLFPSSSAVILSAAEAALKKSCRDYVADVYSGDVVVFLDDGASSQWLPTLRALNHTLQEKGLEPLCVYARNLENTIEVRQTYLDITQYVDAARNLYRSASILSYHEILYAKSCMELLSQGEEAVNAEMQAMKYLRSCGADMEKELIETLTSFYFDSGMSVSKTAEQLFVHVNTVKYRLRKISEIIGCGVTDMPEMIELYQALALHRLLHEL